MSAADNRLKPCPACGKPAGELKHTAGARFPFSVQCRECGFSTPAVRVESVALQFWDDAKRPKEKKGNR